MRRRRILVVAAAAVSIVANPADAATVTRLVYSSDWAGADTIYSIDPHKPDSTAVQLTVRQQRTCPKRRCGAVDPTPSPNGRSLAYVLVEGTDASLYVARADGAGLQLVSTAVQRGSLAWAPGSGRLAYGAHDSLFVYDLARRTSRRVDNNVVAASYTTVWTGPVLAYLRRTTTNGPGELMVSRGRGRRLLDTGVWQFALAPKGGRLAYVKEGLRVVNPDGTGRRLVAADVRSPLWSPDGRRLAGVRVHVLPNYRVEPSVIVFDFKTRGQREFADAYVPMAWSPSGRNLAVTHDGIDVVDLAAGTRRRVSTDQPAGLSWSPAGNEVAYVTRRPSLLFLETTGDLRVAALDRRVRTVVDSAGRYGGMIEGFSWARPPRAMRYRRPRERLVATVSANELVAPWSITKIAVDAGRVVYAACNHVFVWTPASGDVRQADPVASFKPACGFEYEPAAYADVFDLGIAGNRIAFGETYGCNGGRWAITTLSLADPGAAETLGIGSGSRCGNSHFDITFGHIHGAGDLLVYTSWQGRTAGFPVERVTTTQTLYEIGGGTVASRDGPLVPLDVERNRIVVDRGTTFAVLARAGTELWSVAGHAAAAAFDGAEVFVAVGGELRAYEAASGVGHGTWQLPSTDVGVRCATPFFSWCPTTRLVVQDASRMLVAYTLDGRIGVLRLKDGSRHDAGPGTLAQFLDSGLVVADGARLRLIPFTELE